MLDRSLAAISLLALLVFTFIVVYFVAELDLAIVIIAVLAMGSYDFWATFTQNGNNSGADKS